MDIPPDLTPESLPDDMATTVWVTEHRDLLIATMDATSDLATVSELLATHLTELVTIPTTPGWFLKVAEAGSSQLGAALEIMGLLMLLTKMGLALNQPIDHDQPV